MYVDNHSLTASHIQVSPGMLGSNSWMARVQSCFLPFGGMIVCRRKS